MKLRSSEALRNQKPRNSGTQKHINSETQNTETQKTEKPRNQETKKLINKEIRKQKETKKPINTSTPEHT